MNKKSMTAGELAAHFEVSKRTILRDIDALTMAGIPIYTTQGKGGGISIQDRFMLNKTVVSEEEQRQILFALQGVSATAHIETEGILSRLRSLFEKADTDWIEVDFSRWGRIEEDRAKFNSLKNAIINERAISFTYSNTSGETTERKVYPLKLTFRAVSWYLQAFCLLKNEYRTFKISRMRNIKTQADGFDRGAFQVPEIEAFGFEPFDVFDVKLRIEPEAAYRVYDEFDERCITKNQDGSFIIDTKVPDDGWFYEYVLSYGDSMEVLEPQSMRDEIFRQVEKIKSKYLL